MPIFNDNPLKLKTRSYPTNKSSKVCFEIHEGDLISKIRNTNNYIHINTGGNKGSIFEYKLDSQKFMKLSTRDIAPSRLNVSYNFYLSNSIHPTDIATSFKSNIYPPKNSHWGSSVLDHKWKTKIFIRNIDHNNNSKKGKILFEAFTKEKSYRKSYSIKSESLVVIDVDTKQLGEFSKYFSWKVKSTLNTIEVFWCSFDETTGAVCAEHSF